MFSFSKTLIFCLDFGWESRPRLGWSGTIVYFRLRAPLLASSPAAKSMSQSGKTLQACETVLNLMFGLRLGIGQSFQSCFKIHQLQHLANIDLSKESSTKTLKWMYLLKHFLKIALLRIGKQHIVKML